MKIVKTVLGFRAAASVAVALASVAIAGCSDSVNVGQPGQTLGNSSSGNASGGPQNSAPTGTGTLIVSVADPDGRPLAGALVGVFSMRMESVGTGNTSATGVATIEHLPANVFVNVLHDFGQFFRNGEVAVAQEGSTLLAVTLQPARPLPTVALLPASIPAGSLTADRSELTLEVTLVASASAPFVPSGYASDPQATPSLGLELGRAAGVRQCFVWVDRDRKTPTCGDPWGESPYTVTVGRFDYDRTGAVPRLAAPGQAGSALLMIEQSSRVLELDPAAARSFAIRRFIGRVLAASPPIGLAIAGFADDTSAPGAAALLPERPVWLPLGVASVFSTDLAGVAAAVGMLEPLVGGSAPVFDALEAGFALTTAHAPPGNRAVIALLGGGDEGASSDSERRAALAALRQQRDEAGVQVVLIAAAPATPTEERFALAELSTALRAPAISLGLDASWERGSFAAWDLAADLIDGLPLPSLSAAFRVKANEPGAFPAGTTLYGSLFIGTSECPWYCSEVQLEFAVEIP